MFHYLQAEDSQRDKKEQEGKVKKRAAVENPTQPTWVGSSPARAVPAPPYKMVINI